MCIYNTFKILVDDIRKSCFKTGKHPFDRLERIYAFHEINQAITDTKIGIALTQWRNVKEKIKNPENSVRSQFPRVA